VGRRGSRGAAATLRSVEGRMTMSTGTGVVAALARLSVAVAVVSIVVIGCSPATSHHSSSPQAPPLPLRPVGELALPGNNSRFDYASLDSGRGLLFIAHLGAGEVIEVDVHASTVLRTIANLPQVHGVLVVPERHRLFATATGGNQMVSVDEDTGAVVYRAATGEYPDGLAYDPKRGAVWTTQRDRRLGNGDQRC
jgi:hypothetical protein